MQLLKFAQIVLIVAAAVFVYGFVSVAQDGEARRACGPVCALKPHYAAANRRAPDFTLPDLDGRPVRLSDFRGQVVILNFWSKSCPPCLEEMPSLAELGHELAYRDDVVLVTVTTDESAEDARATLSSVLGEFMVKGRPPFVVLVDSGAEVVAERFGTKLYPETWFVDGRGVIRARVDGARDWSSATTLDYAQSLSDPIGCSIQFRGGRATGSRAGLCKELGL